MEQMSRARKDEIALNYAAYVVTCLGGEVIERNPLGRGGYRMVVAFGDKKMPIKVKACFKGLRGLPDWQPHLDIDGDAVLGTRSEVVLLLDLRDRPETGHPGHAEWWAVPADVYAAGVRERHAFYLAEGPSERHPNKRAGHRARNDRSRHAGQWPDQIAEWRFRGDVLRGRP